MLDIIIDNKNISIKDNQSIEDIIGSNFNIDNVVAAKINNRLVDLSNIINENCTIQLIKNSDEEGLEIIRHTCAHVFGHAIKQLYPDVKMAIGPVIENGFYYDIYSENSISEKELEKIESLMKKLVTKKYIVKREVVDRKKQLKFLQIVKKILN